MQANAYVELKNINKHFGDFKASDDVSFSIEKGKLIGLLGPSGSGKTTILRMLAGLERADSGDIYIDGTLVNDVPASERKIGFVFQNYALFRYKTVYDNIAFGMKIQKFSKADIKNRVDELIELVGLKGLEKRYPRQLSGGQRQRVAFARALAKDEAVEVADEIIITNHGRVEQIGTPVDIYNDPQTEFVAQFLGEPTTLDAYTGFKGFHDVNAGARAILRPEFVNVYKTGEVVPYPVSTEAGVVKRVAFRGNMTELVIRVNGVDIVAHRQLGQPIISEGEEVSVFVRKMFLAGGSWDGVRTEVNEAVRNEESVII